MANRITEILGIEKPIIQGPLAWLTNGRYAGAVSAAGGLGVLGISAGQTVAATTIEETVENMRREIRIAREITDKPLGLNVSQAGASEEEIYEVQRGYLGMRDGMLFGDLSKGFASFGLGISMIDKIEPVAVIMDKLMSGIEDLV